MINDIITFTFGVIEVVILYLITITLNRRNKLQWFGIIATCAVVSCISVIINHFDFNYHIPFMILSYTTIYLCFKRHNWRELVFDCPAAILLLTSIQLLVTISLGFFKINILVNPIIVVLFLGGIALLTLIAYINSRIQIFIRSFYDSDRIFKFLILFNIFIVLTIFSDILYEKTNIFYSTLGSSIVVVIGYFIINITLIFIAVRDSKQKKEMRITSNYIDVMSEANLKLKKKEHDYGKDLAGILPIINSANSLEIAKLEVEKYIDSIKDKYNKQVKSIIIANNTFLAAYLSYFIQEVENKDIEFKYTISSSISDFKFSRDELITVLSNLLDNAVDAVMEMSPQERRITFLLDYNCIMIQNSVPTAFNVASIHKFSKPNYTTKKEGLGIGLGNVETILRKHKINLTQSYKDGYFITEIFLK